MIRALSVIILIAAFPAFVPSLLEDSYRNCRSRFEVLGVMAVVIALVLLWVVCLFWLMSLVTWRPE